ncbi:MULTISPECIES: hypothetical protein [Ramlibacter]|uniref:Uncharacterized protein n=1 Tax=Ramlibacter pinisoli TaxID=2682844 RepID=A0A6N8IZ82_9BURK|nr:MULTISPECIES: hypothetical protein [Ramlibacter]MBA2962135.1 hypothetical protein [Ramlibacter sp. CGMCC 1.13660]MVQ32078.1 hypothetical protein [Ramlibacter pinisoli]
MKLRYYKLRMPTRTPSGVRAKHKLKPRIGRGGYDAAIADLLALSPALADIDFEPPRLDIHLRPADLA